MYVNFKWTRRAAMVGLIGGLAIPGLTYWAIAVTQVSPPRRLFPSPPYPTAHGRAINAHTPQDRYDFVGKGRGESWLRVPPPAASAPAPKK